MIKFDVVNKFYGKKHIIKNLDFEIEPGTILGFIGPNGVGKTTTIKMMTGITNITKGDILLDGSSIIKNPIKAKKKFGLVPDSPDMFLEMNVIDYFNFIADIYDVSLEDRKQRINKYMKEFEIEKYAKETIDSLSHGTRQKVFVIGVLIHEPKIWILDEPLTGLDPEASFKLKKMMKDHASKGNIVFFSTHVLEVAEKLCTKIAIINNGEIIFLGKYEELAEKYDGEKDLEKLYLKIIGKEKINENI